MDFRKMLGDFPIIKTENLVLRQLRHEDARCLFEYYANPNLYQYLDWYGPQSLEESAEIIDRWNQGYEEGWIIRFGITIAGSDEVIGSIFLSEFEGRRAEIGYELSEKYWRRGIMNEAMDAVLDLGFSKLQCIRIQAFARAENTASRHLLVKKGFVEEGFLRQYETHISGHCSDMYIYGRIESR
jgi:ribosomal-protein-alanine N-acetyltransferase